MLGDEQLREVFAIICTDSGASACTLTITTTTLSTSVTGGSASNLSLPLSTYSTVRAVVDYINRQPYYVAVAFPGMEDVDCALLTAVAGQSIFGYTTLDDVAAEGATTVPVAATTALTAGDCVYLQDASTATKNEIVKVGSVTAGESFDIDTDYTAGLWFAYESGSHVFAKGTPVTAGGVAIDRQYLIDNFFYNLPDTSKIPTTLTSQVASARRELEKEIGIASFELKTISEKHDYTIQDFRETFWLLQCRKLPVKAVTAYGLYWGEQEIAGLSENLTQWVVVDEMCGTLELIPNALGTSGLLYSAMITGLTRIIPGFVMYERLPVAFHITYTAGLDYNNMTAEEKEDIRYGIARRVAIKLLPKVEPVGAGNESVSIDGASQGVGYGGSGKYGRLAEELKREDKDWVEYMKREYGLELQMVVS